jgi:hypothetical protein
MSNTKLPSTEPSSLLLSPLITTGLAMLLVRGFNLLMLLSLELPDGWLWPLVLSVWAGVFGPCRLVEGS